MNKICPRCGKEGFAAFVDGKGIHKVMFFCSDKDCMSKTVDEIERESKPPAPPPERD